MADKYELGTCKFTDEVYYETASGVGLIWAITHEPERAKRKIRDALNLMEPRPKCFGFSGARGLFDEDDESYKQMWVSKLPDNDMMTLREFIAGDDELSEMYPGLSPTPVAHERNLVLENFGYNLDAALSDAMRVPSTDAQPVCVILEDFDKYLETDDRRRLTSLLVARTREYQTTSSVLVILTTNSEVPEDLIRSAKKIELDLPSDEDFGKILDEVIEGVEATTPEETEKLKEALRSFERSYVVKAMRGLTEKEGQDILAKLISKERVFDPKSIGREKALKLAQDGIIEYIDVGDTMSSFGGYKVATQWIKEDCAGTLSDDARDFGSEDPLGMVLVGPPGTGKTYLAQLVATELGCPAVIAHFERCYGSLVGETGRKVRRMLATIRAMAPVVAIYDEVEKILSGGESSGKTDGGTTSRALGALLTDLSEPRPGVFTVMTSNNIEGMRGELFRSGRNNKTLLMDSPNEDERLEILDIHIDKRANERNGLADVDRGKLAEELDGFSGADIKELIIQSIRRAYVQKSKVTTDIILGVAEKMVPVSKLFSEQIQGLQRWGKKHGVENASAPVKKKKAVSSSRKVKYKA